MTIEKKKINWKSMMKMDKKEKNCGGKKWAEGIDMDAIVFQNQIETDRKNKCF